jgi:S1-C subfamily serine protease
MSQTLIISDPAIIMNNTTTKIIQESIVSVLGCILVLLSTLPTVVSAGLFTPDEYKIHQEIKKAVVKITSNNRVGTGFVVKATQNKVYIITVAHTIEGDPQPMVNFFGNNEFKATVIHAEDIPDKGLALLLLEGIPQNVSPLSLSEKNLSDFIFDLDKRDATISTYGFPQGGADWAYTELTYSGQKGRDLVFSGNIQEGNSGGPLIKKGKVIGIITARGPFVHATSALTIKEFLIGLLGAFPDNTRPKTTGSSDNRDVQPEPPKEEIASLLKTCQIHFNANRLTTGRGGTAL